MKETEEDTMKRALAMPGGTVFEIAKNYASERLKILMPTEEEIKTESLKIEGQRKQDFFFDGACYLRNKLLKGDI